MQLGEVQIIVRARQCRAPTCVLHLPEKRCISTTTGFIQITNSPKNLKISSQNILQGLVAQVIRTEISSQVTIKVIQEVELTSIIPTVSADEMEFNY